ncbi:RNA polymerase sigma factor [Humibacter sp. RRB41]|uniref:RNA polymerase sigma factor n=1 Tax=Humibacter sp. RRB41 TaxID=2919946 RepID=UPI001FAA6713|nr:DUF6596 domain-containing protein [Humibacter sp. RRB41]
MDEHAERHDAEEAPSGADRLVAVVERDHARLLAVLAAETRDITAAEDALADAYERAVRGWPASGIPSNPQGWLLTVARNRLKDRYRSAAFRTSVPLNDETDAAPATAPVAATAIDDAPEPDEIPDKRLALLFVCAHPAIDPSVRTPLMLQTVLGLDARRIAVAFAVPEPTMTGRLVRAKRKIRAAGIPFAVPDRRAMPARLPPVLEAVYGAYAIEWRPIAGVIERGSLSAESLALADLLAELLPQEPEVLGLDALLHLSAARQGAALDALGQFVPLDEQDPERWDAALIARGEDLLLRASRFGVVGRFQLEAAIQSAHDARAHGIDVDPVALRRLHEVLVGMRPTLGARVALAATIADADGASAGLAALDAIGDVGMERFQPAWATRAHLLSALGRRDEADASYDRAISLTTDPVLRAHLERRRSRSES